MHSEIASLQPNQQEADTSITIYIKYSEDPGFTFVVVCTPGRDIFAIFFFSCLLSENNYLCGYWNKKQERLLNASELASTIGEKSCTTFLGLHVPTEKDCTSMFKRKDLNPLRFQILFRLGSMSCFILNCAQGSDSCGYL